MLVDQVERQQRVAQVVEHAHEEHEVEALAQRADVVDGQLAELDVEPGDLGGEAGLGQVVVVEVDAEHALGAAPLHLDRVEAAVAADVEHGLAGEVRRDRVGERSPLHRRVVAEEMVGRGRDAVEVDVVEPGPERLRAAPDLLPREGAVAFMGSTPGRSCKFRGARPAGQSRATLAPPGPAFGPRHHAGAKSRRDSR